MAVQGIVPLLCTAHVLSMVGVFVFPALLPDLSHAWSLSKSEAGWVAGVFFGAYAASVPVLVTLTDRIDGRIIYAAGAFLAAGAGLGLAVATDGFWPALIFRAVAGVGLAATYMPGLRVLVDRYRGTRPSRAIAFYTASFSLGTALSFAAAGALDHALSWRAAFAVGACAAVVAGLLCFLSGPPSNPIGRPPAGGAGLSGPGGWLSDLRRIVANRAAGGYILGYGVHCWELFALRSWLVAYLSFNLTLSHGASEAWPSPANVAMLTGLLAMAASILGNELCMRFGRIRVVRAIMVASVLSAITFGACGSLSYPVLVVLALLYTAVVQLDSAALTAGLISVADSGRQGASMALFALVGFGGGFFGAIVFGWILDLSGGGAVPRSWALAFASVALVGAFGPLALRRVPRA